MSEFVVGQWVECVAGQKSCGVSLDKGAFYRFKEDRDGCDDIYLEEFGRMSWKASRFRPVEWQVGATYKTTLEGVTATLQGHSDILWYGFVGSECKENYRQWNLVTGLMNGLERVQGLPHLTPHRVTETQSEAKKSGIAAIVGQWPGDESDEQIEEEIKATLGESAQPDPINPPHYQQHPSGVECIQITEHMTFCLGNVVKYLWRAGQKGDAVQDLEKAAWYLDREIKRLKGGA